MADLTTKDAFKTRFGLGSFADDDAMLDVLVPIVTDLCQRRCNRKFFTSTYTAYLNGHGHDKISLAETPIASIASVHMSTGRPRTYDASTILTADTDYVYDADSGIVSLINCSVFPEGERAIRVVYVGGYASNAIPPLLVGAAQEILLVKYKKSKDKTYNVQSLRMGDGEVSFGTQKEQLDDIPISAAQVLDQFTYRGMAA